VNNTNVERNGLKTPNDGMEFGQGSERRQHENMSFAVPINYKRAVKIEQNIKSETDKIDVDKKHESFKVEAKKETDLDGVIDREEQTDGDPENVNTNGHGRKRQLQNLEKDQGELEGKKRRQNHESEKIKKRSMGGESENDLDDDVKQTMKGRQ